MRGFAGGAMSASRGSPDVLPLATDGGGCGPPLCLCAKCPPRSDCPNRRSVAPPGDAPPGDARLVPGDGHLVPVAGDRRLVPLPARRDALAQWSVRFAAGLRRRGQEEGVHASRRRLGDSLGERTMDAFSPNPSQQSSRDTCDKSCCDLGGPITDGAVTGPFFVSSDGHMIAESCKRVSSSDQAVFQLNRVALQGEPLGHTAT